MLGFEIIKRFGSGSASPVSSLDDSVVGRTYVQWTIAADGFTYKRKNVAPLFQAGPWINPQSGMNQYEVRATLEDGDTPLGTLDVWLNLGTDRTWSLSAPDDDKSCNLTIEIRRASDAVVVDTMTISLFASGTVPPL